MDPSFRIAIAISTIVHSVIFAPLCKIPGQDITKPIVVDYVKIKEPDVNIVVRKNSAAIETPKISLAKKIEIAPSRSAAEKAETAKKEARELAKKQAPLRNTKDYINYYQLIREKVRQTLKSRYDKRYAEGDVTLIFILNSNGSLASVDTEQESSSRDPALKDLAMQCLGEAAPFPAFPKELSVTKMSFSLTVSFKRN